MSDIGIAVENLSFSYGNGVHALQDINFSLDYGNVCALVGANGSGKSTLFNCIMGILRPKIGKVFINGLPLKEALRQNSVAYVPQNEQIDWHFPITVEEVVMLGRYGHMGFLRRAQAKDYEKVREAMARLDVLALAKRQIGALSGGQKKRVFLARALAQESRIVLLDEPFTGVDVKTEQAVMDLLQALRREGFLILVSTHNLGAVPQYCNAVILIKKRLIAKGDVDAVYTHENLALAFGGVLKNMYFQEAEGLTIVSDDEHPAVFTQKIKES